MRSILHIKPQARILFALLLTQFIFSITAHGTETFEQAYAPIDVSGITIFIPIDLIPESPHLLTVKTTDDKYLVEWSAISGATRYIIEHKVNEKWVTLNSNVATNSYAVALSYSPEFRVTSCHQFGCSTAQSVNNLADIPLQINSFLPDNYNTEQGESVTLSWRVVGASRVKLTSNKGHNYDNLPFISTMAASTNDMTTFTLTATGFGKQTSQTLTLVKPTRPPSIKASSSDNYLQLFYTLGLEPIERSLLVGHKKHNYVATLNEFLYSVTDENKIAWKIALPGLMANKPILLTSPDNEDYLFFALSNGDVNSLQSTGQGKLCRLSTNNPQANPKDKLHCINMPANAIASPIAYKESSANTEDTRLFQIDIHGKIFEFSPFVSHFSTENSEPIETVQLLNDNREPIRVLTTPKIEYTKKAFVVRTEKNEIVIYPLLNSAVMAQSIIEKSSSKNPPDSHNTGHLKPEPTKATEPSWSTKLD
jgi:hypothetical protein